MHQASTGRMEQPRRRNPQQKHEEEQERRRYPWSRFRQATLLKRNPDSDTFTVAGTFVRDRRRLRTAGNRVVRGWATREQR